MTTHRRRSTGWILAGLVALAAACAILYTSLSGGGRRGAWTCVTSSDLNVVTAWSQMLGKPINCAVVFVDASSTWAQWETPWIASYRQNWPKYDWVDWLASHRRVRHLIVTQSLIPSGLAHSDWLAAGAAGKFEPYARVFAKNLVRAGMGSAIIRLGHEANGNWYADSIPGTPQGDQQWAAFWANTVRAMRSVPGAHFLFDWTVNAGYRPVPLTSFYPGDDVVDIIGVDAYDSLPRPAANRLSALINEPDGLLAVRAFARAHHKPMSIPEWGIAPAGQGGAAGDDPAYVEEIARVANGPGVLYQSYFAGGAQASEMRHAPRSLSAYRRDFGAR